MYANTKGKVTSPDDENDLLEITAGILRGDTLALFIFIIVLELRTQTRSDKL